jgi:hypothetical protein
MKMELSERDKDIDEQERRERIKESRYNRVYERCMTEEIPEYQCKRKKNDGEIGNEKRESRYWTEGEERRCSMCCEERETIEHMWKGCSEMRERERKEQGEILNEVGREIGWMK